MNTDHTIANRQYELLIESLLRASTIASVIEETAEDLDPPDLREMVVALRERILECLAIGQFDPGDVERIQKSVLAEMFTRPDA